MKRHIRNWAAAAGITGLLCAASASATTYTAILTGAKEAPPNSTEGIGATAVKFDAATHVLEISTAFAGLFSNATDAHIHCCTSTPGDGVAGVATGSLISGGFPTGVQTGAYHNVYNTSLASSWSPAFLSANGGTTAGAEAALLAGLDAGSAYFNIHTTAYPGGEVRGFLVPTTPVPEPAGIAMLGLGLPALLLVARRRKSNTTWPLR